VCFLRCRYCIELIRCTLSNGIGSWTLAIAITNSSSSNPPFKVLAGNQWGFNGDWFLSGSNIELVTLLFSYNVESLKCFVFDMVPRFLVWLLFHVHAAHPLEGSLWRWVLSWSAAFLPLVVRWWRHQTCTHSYWTIVNGWFRLNVVISCIHRDCLYHLWVLIQLVETFSRPFCLLIWPPSLPWFWRLVSFDHIWN
jgi:hypothetical protein